MSLSGRSVAPLVALLLCATPLAAARAQPSPDAPRSPLFIVGAATRDITPEGEVNTGGFGFGNGEVLPRQLVSPGSRKRAEGERLYARAVVIANGRDALAFVITENIGMFAKYQDAPDGTPVPGLIDLAHSVASATGIPAENVIAAGNHSHSAPDTLGAWGGVPPEYLRFVHDQALAAVVDAYESRRPAEIVVGVADGRQKFPGSQGSYDLIDNQVCLEVADNDYEGHNEPPYCLARQEYVDADVRVLQARAVSPGAQHSAQGCDGPGQHQGRSCDEVIASFVTYAAHPTLGGAPGLHGDWPEYLSAGLEQTYGGVGIGWPGAIGRVQPERNWSDRKTDFTRNLLTLVDQALQSADEVSDDALAVSKTLIRTEVTNPVLAGLLLHGQSIGAPLMRSREEPWTVGNVIQTVVGAARIGDVAFLGVPGEAYPQIALESADALKGEKTLFTLGVADDMLGYLISHTEDYPVIAAITPVNDNALFNVSPRIGDHVMCAGLRMASRIGFEQSAPPRCAAFDLEDSLTARDF